MPKQIPLSNGGFAVVDDEDFDEASQYTWRKTDTGYVARSLRRGKVTKTIKLHHHLVGKPPPGNVTDHKNADKLDNRRANLRFVSKSLNGLNNQKPNFGARYSKHAKKWEIRLTVMNKYLYFGLFDTEEEARSVAALLHGSLMYHELTKGEDSGLR